MTEGVQVRRVLAKDLKHGNVILHRRWSGAPEREYDVTADSVPYQYGQWDEVKQKRVMRLDPNGLWMAFSNAWGHGSSLVRPDAVFLVVVEENGEAT